MEAYKVSVSVPMFACHSIGLTIESPSGLRRSYGPQGNECKGWAQDDRPPVRPDSTEKLNIVSLGSLLGLHSGLGVEFRVDGCM